MKALIFGEIIWDVYPDRRVIGGAPFNFSAHLAHLGNEVYLMTGVGRDELGKEALSHIRKHGVRENFVQITDKPTGACMVTLDENKVPCYHIVEDVAYDNVTVDDELVESLRALHADAFYFNTLAQRNPISRASIERILNEVPFPTVFCDLNIRPACYTAASIQLCLSRSNMVKISEEEAHFLYDTGVLTKGESSFAEDLFTRYPNLKLLIYTRGGDGSTVYDFANEKKYDSGKPAPVKVLSTVGAGDCYGATFLHHYLMGDPMDDAIAAATARSNIVVSHVEAIPF